MKWNKVQENPPEIGRPIIAKDRNCFFCSILQCLQKMVGISISQIKHLTIERMLTQNYGYPPQSIEKESLLWQQVNL